MLISLLFFKTSLSLSAEREIQMFCPSWARFGVSHHVHCWSKTQSLSASMPFTCRNTYPSCPVQEWIPKHLLKQDEVFPLLISLVWSCLNKDTDYSLRLFYALYHFIGILITLYYINTSFFPNTFSTKFFEFIHVV